MEDRCDESLLDDFMDIVYKCKKCYLAFSDKVQLLEHITTTHTNRTSEGSATTATKLVVWQESNANVEEQYAESQVQGAESQVQGAESLVQGAESQGQGADSQVQGAESLGQDQLRIITTRSKSSFAKRNILPENSVKPKGAPFTGCALVKTKRQKLEAADLKPWQCTKCEATFKLKYLMQKHFNKVHKQAKRKCPKCSVKCATKEELDTHVHSHYMSTLKCVMCDYSNPHWHRIKKHMETHNNGDKYACDKCDMTFGGAATLNYHKRFSHLGGVHLCDECGFSAPSQYWLVQHQMKEHRNQVVCPICHHKCDNEIDMATHNRERHGNGFACKSCATGVRGGAQGAGGEAPVKFATQDELLFHMQRCHPNDKCFFCDKCNYVAKQRQHLTKHMYMHTGERPYKCNHEGCDFETRDHRNLKQHKVVKHRKPGELVCRQCRFVTTSQNEWDIHRAMHHMKIYSCKECDFTSPNSASVRRHRLAKHVTGDQMRYPCPHCAYRSNLKESLLKHLLTHVIRDSNFKCVFCDETMVERDEMKRHLADTHPHETVHLCPHCTYITPKLQFHRQHIAKHTPGQGKPFTCSQCPYAGRTLVLLNSHIANKHSDPSQDFEGRKTTVEVSEAWNESNHQTPLTTLVAATSVLTETQEQQQDPQIAIRRSDDLVRNPPLVVAIPAPRVSPLSEPPVVIELLSHSRQQIS